MPSKSVISHRQPHLLRRKAEQRGCLFLFGDAASCRDMGIIFLGPPGTGKTTTMRLLPDPWHEITQDLVVVFPDKENVARVSSGWSVLEESIEDFSNAAFDCHAAPPLHAIFSLNRSAVAAIKHLNHFEKVDLLMKAIKGVWPESTHGMPQIEAQEHRARCFDSLAWLAKKVPCYQLGLGEIGACQRLIEDVISQSN